MQHNQIPNTDLKVSCITLGTWVFGGDVWGGSKEKESIDAVIAAMDHGINFIDTAPIYGNGLSETIIGKALRRKRDKVILATKCGLSVKGKQVSTDLSPESILKEIDASQLRLNVDYIDLYQCHWPDPNTPIEKTMETLVKLKERKKIRHIGVSNFDKKLLDKTLQCAKIVTLQNQYSMLERSIEEEILPFCTERQVGVICYGPLAGGILSGKYKEEPKFKGGDARSFFYKFYQGNAFKKTEKLLSRLSEIKRPPHEIAINWLRRQKGVTSVITGCRNVQQVEANAKATNWDLTDGELEFINDVLNDKSLCI